MQDYGVRLVDDDRNGEVIFLGWHIYRHWGHSEQGQYAIATLKNVQVQPSIPRDLGCKMAMRLEGKRGGFRRLNQILVGEVFASS